jgi:hypothetical protein
MDMAALAAGSPRERMTPPGHWSNGLLIAMFPLLSPEAANEKRKQDRWEKREVYHSQLHPKGRLKQLFKGRTIKHSRGNEGNYIS